MNFTFNELINKKKNNKVLTSEEIKWLIDAYSNKQIVTDYQMSAMLMAIWFNGMSKEETANLAEAYFRSGKVYDISSIKGWKADKHSTGGVGDKTSLVFAPLLASYGVKVVKLSGRALGKTGGTIDKLESFPGWKENISEDKFRNIVNEIGMSIIGSSPEIAPADKKIYALRDVTGTVDSIPLIAASIMSKKLVIDSDSLILDVKVGKGAFMQDIDNAIKLAETMIEIGKAHNRHVSALITDMNKPLGRAIGNALEVKEAYETLLGQGPEDLNELTEVAVALVLVQAGIFQSFESACQSVAEKLKTGVAADIFIDFIKAQGGDWNVMENYNDNFSVKNKIQILAEQNGYIKYVNADILGYLALNLGGGRQQKDDQIDYAAGIYLNKVSGEEVKKGDVIMTLFTNKSINDDWSIAAKESFIISDTQTKEKIIKKIIN